MQKYSNYIHRINIELYLKIWEMKSSHMASRYRRQRTSYSCERSANITFYWLHKYPFSKDLWFFFFAFVLSLFCFHDFISMNPIKYPDEVFRMENVQIFAFLTNDEILWMAVDRLQSFVHFAAFSTFGFRKIHNFWFALISLNSFINLKMDIDDEAKRFVLA